MRQPLIFSITKASENMSNLNDLLPKNFDIKKEAENAGGDFSPIPQGNYSLLIKKAEIVSMNGDKGKMVKFQLGVIGPSHKNRVIFAQMTLTHNEAAMKDGKPNGAQQSIEIGRAALSSLCVAAGFSSIPDTNDLVGKVIQAYVTIKKDAKYGDSNQVAGFKASSENGLSASSAGDDFSSAGNDDDIPF
jgi:hypothetical protein